jgi:hypothetical protein
MREFFLGLTGRPFQQMEARPEMEEEAILDSCLPT